jgi:UDP-N-acetylmuramate dehydrogenase
MTNTDQSNVDEYVELVAQLQAIDDITIERNVPAGSLCTYRVGGAISVLLHIDSVEALASAVAALSEHEVSTLPLGRGSNLLVADSGFDGVGILLGERFSDITIDGTIVVAGAGASLPVVARATVSAGLDGFAWAVGVPGSIGGAVRMNAGGHGSDIASNLVSVDVADLSIGGILTRNAESLELGYRTSTLAPWQIVVSATIELTEGDIDSGQILLKEIVSWRREHQPGGANAGSVFTNPKDDSAGRLIDVAGFKGRRVGTAHVSTKHANFIQADPEGSADDVMALMIEIVDAVKKDSGVRLHAETRLVGFAPELVAHVQGEAPSGTPKHGRATKRGDTANG